MTWPRPASALAAPGRQPAIGLPPRVWPIVRDGRALGVRYFVSALVAPWIVLTGSTRNILLALVLIDIPLQFDQNFNYLDNAAEFGAVAGFIVSLTTVALVGLYATWFVERFVRRERRSVVPWRLVLPLAAYFAVVALSLVAARDVGLYLRGLFLFVQMFLLFVYLVGTVRSAADVRFVVTWLLCGLVLEGLIIGLGQGLAMPGLRDRVDLPADGLDLARVGGTVGSPNNAAEYFEMLLAPAVAVLASKFGRFGKLLAALGIGLGSIALIETGSRGGWIAAALSLTIVCITVWRRHRRLRLAGLIAALVVTVVLFFHDSITERLTSDDAGSAHVRVPLMATAFRIITDNPVLGVGANNYTAALPDYASRHQDEFLYTVHNQYLLVWAETGIVGLAAFMWFLIATIGCGLRAWRLRDRLLSPLALGFTAALIGQMVHMQVDVLNGRPQLQLLVTVAALLGTMSLSKSRIRHS